MPPQFHHCCVPGQRTRADPRAAAGHRAAVRAIQCDRGNTAAGAGGAEGMKHTAAWKLCLLCGAFYYVCLFYLKGTMYSSNINVTI